MTKSTDVGVSHFSPRSPTIDRRDFLSGAPTLVLTLTAASGTDSTPVNAATPKPNTPVYEETALIRRYYERARF